MHRLMNAWDVKGYDSVHTELTGGRDINTHTLFFSGVWTPAVVVIFPSPPTLPLPITSKSATSALTLN